MTVVAGALAGQVAGLARREQRRARGKEKQTAKDKELEALRAQVAAQQKELQERQAGLSAAALEQVRAIVQSSLGAQEGGGALSEEEESEAESEDLSEVRDTWSASMKGDRKRRREVEATEAPPLRKRSRGTPRFLLSKKEKRLKKRDERKEKELEQLRDKVRRGNMLWEGASLEELKERAKALDFLEQHRGTSSDEEEASLVQQPSRETGELKSKVKDLEDLLHQVLQQRETEKELESFSQAGNRVQYEFVHGQYRRLEEVEKLLKPYSGNGGKFSAEEINRLRLIVAGVMEAMVRRKEDLRIADKDGWKVVEEFRKEAPLFEGTPKEVEEQEARLARAKKLASTRPKTTYRQSWTRKGSSAEVLEPYSSTVACSHCGSEKHSTGTCPKSRGKQAGAGAAGGGRSKKQLFPNRKLVRRSGGQ